MKKLSEENNKQVNWKAIKRQQVTVTDFRLPQNLSGRQKHWPIEGLRSDIVGTANGWLSRRSDHLRLMCWSFNTALDLKFAHDFAAGSRAYGGQYPGIDVLGDESTGPVIQSSLNATRVPRIQFAFVGAVDPAAAEDCCGVRSRAGCGVGACSIG